MAGELLPRRMVPSGKTLPGGTRLKVLQWNVLADGMSGNCESKGGFTRLPAEALEWKARHAMHLQHIEGSGADIITMQEVDHSEDWIKEMSALGYDGRFRADEYSPCLKWALGEPKLPDGVALFWKRDRLELDECALGVNVDDGGKVLKRKRIFARLKALDTGAFVVLATTHLKSGKGGGARRARQSESLIADFKQFAQSEEKPASAVFITGDFNGESSNGLPTQPRGRLRRTVAAQLRAANAATTSCCRHGAAACRMPTPMRDTPATSRRSRTAPATTRRAR